MLVTQHAICKEISCATCYWAHGLDSCDDHFNCLWQCESIHDSPELIVCSDYDDGSSFPDTPPEYYPHY